MRDGVLLYLCGQLHIAMSVEKVGTNLRIPNNVKQGNNVGSTSQILQNLDLSLNLLLLDRLQDLDNALLVVDNIDTLKDFRVLSAACSAHNSVNESTTNPR